MEASRFFHEETYHGKLLGAKFRSLLIEKVTIQGIYEGVKKNFKMALKSLLSSYGILA